MSWKIKTDPETPYLFVPSSNTVGGGVSVPFDVQGMASSGYWVSGVCDLGPAPRTNKFWWQAKSAFANPLSPGSFVSFYAATMDDNDLSNVDSLPIESGSLPIFGNYGVPAFSTNGVPTAACTNNLPLNLSAAVTTAPCPCFEGTYSLSWNPSLGVWAGPAISSCSGESPGLVCYPQFYVNSVGMPIFGFAGPGSVIGNGDSAASDGSVQNCSPFSAEGFILSNGNLNSWCESGSTELNWTVTGSGNAVPNPILPVNLHYLGCTASDGTGGSGVPNVSSGYAEIESRYIYLVAYNDSPLGLSDFAADHQFYLRPVPNEVQ